MEDRLEAAPPAASDADPARCFVAIELSKKSWVVAIHTPLTSKPSRYTVKACDATELLRLIGRVRRRVCDALGRPVQIISCYEAGYDGFWLHRRLQAAGICNHVLDPASLQVNRRARQVKTDRIDVERELRALMSYWGGDRHACSVLRVPSPEHEDARLLHRERDDLIGERVEHVNRIKGLLAMQGIYTYEPLWRDRWKRLRELRTADGRALPERLKANITRELRRLELVLDMIKELEAERDTIAKGSTSTHPNAKNIQALMRLRAFGPEFSTVLAGEVFYRSFNNRRQVASYVGLTPSPFNSGPSDRDQGISKAGNPKARSTMIEAAWMWVFHQPASALTVWFNERVKGLKGRPRRIAIVAVARKLLVALWRYLDTGLVPTGAVLKV
jgi:transposase